MSIKYLKSNLKSKPIFYIKYKKLLIFIDVKINIKPVSGENKSWIYNCFFTRFLAYNLCARRSTIFHPWSE